MQLLLLLLQIPQSARAQLAVREATYVLLGGVFPLYPVETADQGLRVAVRELSLCLLDGVEHRAVLQLELVLVVLDRLLVELLLVQPQAPQAPFHKT